MRPLLLIIAAAVASCAISIGSYTSAHVSTGTQIEDTLRARDTTLSSSKPAASGPAP